MRLTCVEFGRVQVPADVMEAVGLARGAVVLLRQEGNAVVMSVLRARGRVAERQRDGRWLVRTGRVKPRTSARQP